jgi:hypothetical protein
MKSAFAAFLKTVPEDYYTMSRAGITHFCKGESEFTSLDNWEREFFLFNMIRKVRLLCSATIAGAAQNQFLPPFAFASTTLDSIF